MKRGAALALAFIVSVARADDKATADVLFQEATKLINAGNYAQACPKLADSQRLDPGIGTALYLGDCYEKVGKTASAWGSFREALSLAERAGDQKRAQVAKRRADALEAILSRLTLKLDAGIDANAVRIERNDKRVAASEIGLPIPVDPGAVTVTCRAEGRQTWETTVQVPEKNGALEVVIKLGPVGSAASKVTAAPPTTTAPTLTKAAAPTPDAGPSPLTPLRLAGLGAGVLGLAAIGVGVGVAIGAKGTFDSSNQMGRCDAQGFCTSEGLKIRADARAGADVATVMFIAGGVLAAAGVTMFLVGSPKRASAIAPVVGPSYAGAHAIFAF